MNRYLFAACALIVTSVAVSVRADTYRTYRNARFGYKVDFPSRLVPEPEADNGDGRRFRSRDRKILLRVWGQYDSDNRGLRGQMQRATRAWQADGARLTYRKSGATWYVLSGFIEGDIFYEKTVRRGDTFATLIWEYPRSMRAQLDAPVTRSVRSFRVAPTKVALVLPAPQIVRAPVAPPAVAALPRVVTPPRGATPSVKTGY